MSLTFVSDPIGLSLDTGDIFDRIEQEFSLGGVFDIGVYQERVRLGVDIFPLRWW